MTPSSTSPAKEIDRLAEVRAPPLLESLDFYLETIFGGDLMTAKNTPNLLSSGTRDLKEGQFTVGNDPQIYELSESTQMRIAANPASTVQLIACEMFERISAQIRAIS